MRWAPDASVHRTWQGEPLPGMWAAGTSTAMSRPVRALNSASSATLNPVHAAATFFDPSGVMTGLNTLVMPPAGVRSVLMTSRDAVSAAVAADRVSSTRTPPALLLRDCETNWNARKRSPAQDKLVAEPSAAGTVHDFVAPVTRDSTMIPPVAVVTAANRASGETANSGSPLLPLFRAATGMSAGADIGCGFPSSPSLSSEYRSRPHIRNVRSSGAAPHGYHVVWPTHGCDPAQCGAAMAASVWPVNPLTTLTVSQPLSR